MKEYEFYNNIRNWDFSMINYEEEVLSSWDLYKLLKEFTTKDSKVLDLGTGGGEKVLKYFPEVKEIVATDFSEAMINTANNNLKNSGRSNITFRQMDNLNMDTPDEYFDVVVARHTVIDANGIYKTLKNGGVLLVRGVDKEDSKELKDLFGYGQAYFDPIAISQIDLESIKAAGFKEVVLTDIYINEYYKTKEDLIALLLKVPILDDFSEIEENKGLVKKELDINLLDEYIKKNTTEKGILLKRKYYGIIAKK